MPSRRRDGPPGRRRTTRRSPRRTDGRRPASSRRSPLLLLLPLLPGASAAASLRRATASTPAVFPYTPTTILVPSSNSSLVYIFTPDDSGQVSFLSLNISSTLSATDSDRVTTLTQGVPFLSNDGQENTASTFTAAVRADSAVVVYAGDCSSSDAASIWTYVPPTDDTDNSAAASAQWTSGTVSLESSQSGPWFLGRSTAFSSQLEPTVSNATLYVYGGMCPSTSSTGTATTWQAKASYSNKMLKLLPSTGAYVPSIVSSDGAPIAEAGFSLTTLSPSLANRSGIVTQQVNSVLLGGHTSAAFINMSTAAIWSLPEEAWSFVSIADPATTSSGSTELAVIRRGTSASAPDSRSGHTAVLSEDGTSIVVLGGWVGDVTQAADPQLAVLEMGAGYGQWQWSIPAAQPSDTGIYGHGAAMLPGNVMMVYGGYNISASSSSTKRVRRQANQGNLQFFNLTSLSWSTEYINPTRAASSASAAAPSEAASSSHGSSKVGLGVGLGLGLPLGLVLAALLFCFCRRRSRQRRRRGDLVNALAQDHNEFIQGHDEMIETAGYAAFPTPSSPHDRNSYYIGGHDPYNVAGPRPLPGSDSLSPAFPTYQSPSFAGGSGDAAPVRAQPPLRSVARGLYQPTSMNDYEASLAMGGAAGAAAAAGIHPIYEADEEDDEGAAGAGTAAPTRGTHRRGASSVTADSIEPPASAVTEELTDPFMTPSTVSMAVSPMRSVYAGAFAPNTVHLNPFVRNTPSPEAGYSLQSRSSSPTTDANTERGRHEEGAAGASGPSTVGQDQDVQHWVAGLAIEDLLFSAPAPGAGAAVAASVSPTPSHAVPAGSQRGRISPTSVSYWPSLRSKASSAGSPTRSSFFGGNYGRAGGGSGSGSGEEEARTGSNLSDRSAFTFLSHTASARSRRGGGAGAYTILDPKVSNSDTTMASYHTAPSGFQSLRVEGPSLLYGKSHKDKDGSSADSSGGEKSLFSTDTSSYDGSSRVGAVSPNGYHLAPPPPLHSTGDLHQEPSPGAYGGAASVLASGVSVGVATAYAPLDHFRRPQGNHEEEENTALSGSPSKRKSRRTWMNSFMRIFSSGPPANGNDEDASHSFSGPGDSMGTGAQQGPNFRDVAHATLLRRKQGRFDWEADEVREEENTAAGALRTGRSTSNASAGGLGHGHGYGHGHPPLGTNGPATSGVPASGSIAAGRRDNSNKSDEWDVEKAVQSRVVQVMFTMPRDQRLRVVNGEAEKEDEDGDTATLNRKPSSAAEPQDGTRSPVTDVFDEKAEAEETHLGGLSPPPPAPPVRSASVLQRPLQSYQRDLIAADTAAVSRSQGRPPDPQDELLLRMEEDLIDSRQRLSEKAALEPWMFWDEDKSRSENGSEGDGTAPDAVPSSVSKGKAADVGRADDSDSFPPARPTTPGARPDDRVTTATADILQAGGSAAGKRSRSPAKAAAAAEAEGPTTPVRALRPVRSGALLRKTPTQTTPLNRTPTWSPSRTPRTPGDRPKTPSVETLRTDLSSRMSWHSAASGKRFGLAESTLVGSPVASEVPGLAKKPSRYVLDMVEKIETEKASSKT